MPEAEIGLRRADFQGGRYVGDDGTALAFTESDHLPLPLNGQPYNGGHAYCECNCKENLSVPAGHTRPCGDSVTRREHIKLRQHCHRRCSYIIAYRRTYTNSSDLDAANGDVDVGRHR